MDLQKIIDQTNSKAIYLINKKGNIIDFYSENNKANMLKEKTAAFTVTVFNMSSHFFSSFYNTELDKMILKSKKEHLFLVKYKEYILALLFEKNLNISLTEIILRKELTTT